MTNQKLLMFAVAGILAPSAAMAKVNKFEILPSPVNDLAPTTGQGATERLAMTDQEQSGTEQAAFAMLADGVHGFYFAMRTELNGQPAPNDMQCAMVPFKLKVETDKSIGVELDTAFAPRFITNNNGNETRNCNHPYAYAIAGGNAACVEYNYQAAGQNDTKRYVQCFNKAGTEILGQTQVIAKNNDDCGMQDDNAPVSRFRTEGLTDYFGGWYGCNGNGRDDGWAQIQSITVDNALNPTSATFQKIYDASLCNNEERSHGGFVFNPADPNTGYVFWTEGNNQPQRDGTWVGAIDLTPGAFTGANQQGAVLWKQMIDGRIETGGEVTYSMRAMLTPLLQPADASTATQLGVAPGTPVPGNLFIWRSGDVQGNNNNNEKGGEYKRHKMGVLRLTRAGLSYESPLADYADTLAGLDGTHLVMTPGVYGELGALKSGVSFLEGTHTGGGVGNLRIAAYNAGTKTFEDGGEFSTAPYDRHLYSNYLGNNPGNQGRNFAKSQLIPNPFLDTAAGIKDAYLLLVASSGKENSMNPSQKLAGYLSVVPVAQAKEEVTNPNPDPTPDPVNPNPEPTGEDPRPPSDSVGGCSTSNSTGGLASFLIVGLAAFIRRRRRA